jgi:hypothetical protein
VQVGLHSIAHGVFDSVESNTLDEGEAENLRQEARGCLTDLIRIDPNRRERYQNFAARLFGIRVGYDSFLPMQSHTVKNESFKTAFNSERERKHHHSCLLIGASSSDRLFDGLPCKSNLTYQTNLATPSYLHIPD